MDVETSDAFAHLGEHIDALERSLRGEMGQLHDGLRGGMCQRRDDLHGEMG